MLYVNNSDSGFGWNNKNIFKNYYIQFKKLGSLDNVAVFYKTEQDLCMFTSLQSLGTAWESV